ncbi:hypothetical protein J3R03_008196 [Actinoplanes couchii]|nr:hypothetical protein [Actinoplanes couchii]
MLRAADSYGSPTDMTEVESVILVAAGYGAQRYLTYGN